MSSELESASGDDGAGERGDVDVMEAECLHWPPGKILDLAPVAKNSVT